jgi:hydroxypyruvate reductase
LDGYPTEVQQSDMTQSLRETALEIFTEAMDACSVASAFASKIRMADRNTLQLSGEGMVDLSLVKRIVIVAMGKGAASMLDVILKQRQMMEGREVSGILIALKPLNDQPKTISFYAGGHPLPNAESVAAARAVLELLTTSAADPLADETFCLFLISGGASAMMEFPLDPAISLEEMILFHRALVHSGASITEINCVRKHFSAVKGGRLALAAGALRSLTLVVSDVPADQLDALASGPTVPDSSTVDECRSIIEKYGLLRQFPESVQQYFESAALKESPKPGEIATKVYSLLSSEDLAHAASDSAERRGFKTFIDNTCDDWDYGAAADYLMKRLELLKGQYGRVCLVSAGEVTVRVPKEKKLSVGGRNLHFALYSALHLQSSRHVAILSAGSDGVDGNSPAAGAVVDGTTMMDRYENAKKDFEDFNSFDLLRDAGAAIMTGPTGNNLRDLRILLADGL